MCRALDGLISMCSRPRVRCAARHALCCLCGDVEAKLLATRAGRDARERAAGGGRARHHHGVLRAGPAAWRVPRLPPQHGGAPLTSTACALPPHCTRWPHRHGKRLPTRRVRSRCWACAWACWWAPHSMRSPSWRLWLLSAGRQRQKRCALIPFLLVWLSLLLYGHAPCCAWRLSCANCREGHAARGAQAGRGCAWHCGRACQQLRGRALRRSAAAAVGAQQPPVAAHERRCQRRARRGRRAGGCCGCQQRWRTASGQRCLTGPSGCSAASPTFSRSLGLAAVRCPRRLTHAGCRNTTDRGLAFFHSERLCLPFQQ